MTSAFHRSKLFWFGLIALAFLLWAWADSRTNSFMMKWQSASMGLSASHYASLITLGRVQDGIIYGPADNKIHFQRNHIAKLHPRFPSFRTYETRIPSGLSQSVSIPYWSIVALHLTTWCTVLIWRRRRVRKALSSTAALDAGLPSGSPADS